MTTWPRCGHPKTPENVNIFRGKARCLACKRRWAREYANRKAAESRAARPEGWMSTAARFRLIRRMEKELKVVRRERLAEFEARKLLLECGE